MSSKDIREKYIKFFESRGHKEIAPAKLVPENDPSTLFTSSGMQPLVPYLLGQTHPSGKRLVDSQPCFRAEDIEEVGDSRHTTFFEMLGNWSLGEYFKKEQLPWIWEFLTKELGLAKERLYVSVFVGNDSVAKDMETFNIWKSLGVSEDNIFFYGVSENWWSRSGSPEKMPEGEIGGPDSEIFYDFYPEQPFKEDLKIYSHNGRLLEIGNSVFIEYQKKADGSLEELDQKNVDFGGGLERLTAAVNNTPDIFQTDLYLPIIHTIEKITLKKYEDNKTEMQVIADHMKAAIFMIRDGVEPSNKLQGYILRRLLRRLAVKVHLLKGGVRPIDEYMSMAESVINIYSDVFIFDKAETLAVLHRVIADEMTKFANSLIRGMKVLQEAQLDQLHELFAFNLYQTYGFPYEVTEELLRNKGVLIDKGKFNGIFEAHKQLSRKASAGMFKGGLADHSEVVIKYHTATHLLHQALRDVLGPEVFQKGSNITSERLRFDFSFDRKMTDEEIKQVESLVNEKIAQNLKVDRKIVSPSEANNMGAIGLFNEKYGNEVSIYGIGPDYKLDPKAKDQRQRSDYYSLEFCGGPHVEHTGIIGKTKITKEEAVSAGIRRIRAEIVLR